jgi:D-lactate dehydrogenase
MRMQHLPQTAPPPALQVIKHLAKAGVKFIAMRCAGYDRVDVAAANAAGIKGAREAAFAPDALPRLSLV